MQRLYIIYLVQPYRELVLLFTAFGTGKSGKIPLISFFLLISNFLRLYVFLNQN